MDERVRKLEKFVHQEENGQRWRRITPITAVSQLFVSIGGFGMLAWFAVYIIGNFDKQLDLLNGQINNIHVKMEDGRNRQDDQISGINSRINCLVGNARACCQGATNC